MTTTSPVTTDSHAQHKRMVLDRNAAELGYLEGTANEPINDIDLALQLLVRDWNDRTNRELRLRSPDSSCIWYGIFTGGYTKDQLSNQFEFQVTETIAKQLINAGFVEGIKGWGYTSTTEFKVSERGEKELFEEIKRRGL